MANGCCTNELCIDRETQLRLARLREELLTSFNTLLIDRIRFLEQTVNRLSLPTSLPPTEKCPSTEPVKKDLLSAPSLLRRSSSATVCLLQSPFDPKFLGIGAGPRSCPSSVDLTSNTEQRKRFFSGNRASHSDDRSANQLCIPSQRQWASSTSDLASSTHVNSEKGRLESRRFACDVDDNDVRALKAMIYMEQARKQHARPLTRLRQVLRMSSHSHSTGSYASVNVKKHPNA